MASKRIRDLIKSVNLWFFDRLLFDAGQEKYTEKLNRCLDEELDNPKDCYQRLTASNDFCVEDMNKVFAGTYVFDAATLKRLFELGWDQHLYIYISLPFIEAAEFSGYDLDSVATGVITNSGYNCEKLLNLINMLVEDKPIKNQPFLDLVKELTKQTVADADVALAAINAAMSATDNDNNGNVDDDSGLDSDDDDDDEINVAGYSAEERMISKFHTAVDRLYGGVYETYLEKHRLYGYYSEELDTFVDQPAGIKEVTTDLALDHHRTVTVNTENMTFKQIAEALEVYKTDIDVFDITFVDGKITVTSE